MKQSTQMEKRNDPNVNFGMYEADREAKRKAQPQLPSVLQSAESERQILRCAPPFDAQAEHEADLAYESRVDAESWQYDGPAEREDY